MTARAPRKKVGGRQRGTPNKVSKATISKDIRLQTLTALNFVGGVQFLVRQARKKNNAPFMALLGKCLQQDDGAGDANIRFVVQTINVTGGPVPGVLNSPVVEHVQPPLRLASNGGHVVETIEPEDDAD
jgi:hypothetical protein